MSNQISATGLVIDTLNDIVDQLTTAMQTIYGSDINVDSNSPDGQLINTFAQVAEDILQLVVQVYNSFSVQNAFGTVLDQRVAINGITRKQGTFTIAPVLVTVNQSLTLYGLDQTAQPPFTVSDNAGNQYALITTTTFGGSGFASLLFQAVTIGQVEVVANTITNQVTTVLGVVSVNNPLLNISTTGDTNIGQPQIPSIPSTANMAPGMLVAGTGIPVNSKIVSVDSTTQITINANATANGTAVTITVSTVPVVTGVEEETDAQLKIRQAQSFALASTGPADAISAALLAIPDVTDAYVVENYTGNTVNTVPAHSIWCIVTGGTPTEIGQAIYAKKGIGCGMKGSQSISITRPNGTAFVPQWDDSLTEPLYIQFTINPITPGQSFDTSLLTTQLAAALVYKLGVSPNVGDVVNAMLTLAPTAYLTDIGVSTDGITYDDVVSPSDAQHYFTVSAAHITIST